MTTDDNKALQIESLRRTISSAEKTIQSAKAMLLQLEGKKKAGRYKKISSEDEGEVVFGTFDGQIMIGDDGKQYPVPANYASKSKLVEGDMLKLTINDGNFLYKQVGPVERKNLIGIAGQDEGGNYFVISEGVPYKILLASITYFKIEPGDEVVITVPAGKDSVWAAIENVLQKNDDIEDYREQMVAKKTTKKENSEEKEITPENDPIEEIIQENGSQSTEEEKPSASSEEKDEEKDLIIDEWMQDIEEIKKEIQEEKNKIEA
ncbi:MAG: hypothetical protein V3574_01030 [Candidatus Moraniibacteriota bacterium]